MFEFEIDRANLKAEVGTLRLNHRRVTDIRGNKRGGQRDVFAIDRECGGVHIHILSTNLG